jgi:acylphosphatase
VTVRGRVQGVFFRDTARRVAQELDIAGWVRNADDGAVQAHLEGEPRAVEQMLRFLRQGPPDAAVTDVDVTEVAVQELSGFAVR